MGEDDFRGISEAVSNDWHSDAVCFFLWLENGWHSFWLTIECWGRGENEFQGPSGRMRARNSLPVSGSPRSSSRGGSLRHCTKGKNFQYLKTHSNQGNVSQFIHFYYQLFVPFTKLKMRCDWLKVSNEKRLWKRLCQFHFSTHQINFILDEMAKQREKNAQNNNFNKNNNRSSRTLHPYNNNNNSNNNSNYASRQNSVQRSCDSNESDDNKQWVNFSLKFISLRITDFYCGYCCWLNIAVRAGIQCFSPTFEPTPRWCHDPTAAGELRWWTGQSFHQLPGREEPFRSAAHQHGQRGQQLPAAWSQCVLQS